MRRPLRPSSSTICTGISSSTRMEKDPIFGLFVPTAAEGVDPAILRPRDTWSDKGDYDAQARRLVSMFAENFKKFKSYVGPDVTLTAPALRAA